MKGEDAERVAKAMNTTVSTLRWGLEQGKFPFGTAVLTSETAGRKNYAYLLFKAKVKEYLGVDLNAEVVQIEEGSKT
jgi:hypothetical protein